MSTWVAPITWTSSQTVTASQMNGLRDNLVFLKGFGDLITNSTTADTGTSTYLSITRATASVAGYRSLVTGDSYARFQADADGKLWWGSGSATADFKMYRYLTTLSAEGPTDCTFNLYGGVVVGADNYGAGSSGRFLYLTERVDTSAADANGAYFYARDNGAGKTQLVARFNSGAVQVIATEP